MSDEMELAGCTYAWTGRTTHLLEGTRLTELGLYMEVMHIASGALETAFCLCIGVGWARTYHAAHGSSYADDNKSALHTQLILSQDQSSETELPLTCSFSIMSFQVHVHCSPSKGTVTFE